jgi:hypothetical protein
MSSIFVHIFSSDMYFPFVRLPPPLGMGLGCFIRIEVVGQVSYVRILGLPALPRYEE